MTTSTSARPAPRQHRDRPGTARRSRQASAPCGHTRAPSTVSPVQFVAPEHAQTVPEPHQPIADHSEAGMRRLRTPFDLDSA
jgi:hypothetical protein